MNTKGDGMNERIKELWTQAEEEIKAEYEDESRRNRRLYNEIFLPKFAELIVRECRDIVEQDMKLAHIQMIPLTLEKYANDRLKEKIREHFGVEP